MNKTELIENVARNTSSTKADAKVLVQAVLDAIVDGTESEGKVSLTGFGTFSKATRKAREGRNPSTGAKIQIAEKEVVKFKSQF